MVTAERHTPADVIVRLDDCETERSFKISKERDGGGNASEAATDHTDIE
jgi:hypothetical protein